MTPIKPEVAKLVASLTKASTRALPHIRSTWTQEGSPGPKREDAYSLGWGRNSHPRLIEVEWRNPGRWFYRLTPTGEQVRQALMEQANERR